MAVETTAVVVLTDQTVRVVLVVMRQMAVTLLECQTIVRVHLRDHTVAWTEVVVEAEVILRLQDRNIMDHLLLNLRMMQRKEELLI